MFGDEDIVTRLYARAGMDTLYIGEAPAGEDCLQINQATMTEMRKECGEFSKLLRLIFGNPPKGAAFKIKSNSHDFGVYYSVEIAFKYGPNEDEESGEHNPSPSQIYAYAVEANTPEFWHENHRFDWQNYFEMNDIPEVSRFVPNYDGLEDPSKFKYEFCNKHEHFFDE